MPINIDLQRYLDEVKNTLLNLAAEAAPKTETVILEYVATLQERISALLNYVSVNGTDKEVLIFVLDRLKEEKDILYSELLSLLQIAEAVAQTAINTVQGIIVNAITEEINKFTVNK